MNRFLMVSFKYADSLHYAIVRVKERGDRNEHYITVMNGEIEKMLHGNHIITEADGCLQLEITEIKEIDMIREGIAGALGQLLNLSIKKIEASKEHV